MSQVATLIGLIFAAERWVTGLAESAPIALMLAVLAFLFVGIALYKLSRRLSRQGKKRPADHGG